MSLGLEQLAALGRIAGRFVAAREAFDTLDIGDDGYAEAQATFETAVETWDQAVSALGDAEDRSDLAILATSIAPIVDEVARHRRREDRGSKTTPKTPHQLSELCAELEVAIDNVRFRFGVLHDSGYETAKHGGAVGGERRSNPDGTPAAGAAHVAYGASRDSATADADELADAPAHTERCRQLLGQTSRRVVAAVAMLRGAQHSLDRLEELIDSAMPKGPEWSFDHQRERSASLDDLIRAHERALEPLRAQKRREDERIRNRAAAAAKKAANARKAAPGRPPRPRPSLERFEGERQRRRAVSEGGPGQTAEVVYRPPDAPKEPNEPTWTKGRGHG